MLDAQNAHGIFAPHDGHAGERMKQLFAGFGLVGKIGVAGGLVKVERGDVPSDHAD
jgi:hypothetical protein